MLRAASFIFRLFVSWCAEWFATFRCHGQLQKSVGVVRETNSLALFTLFHSSTGQTLRSKKSLSLACNGIADARITYAECLTMILTQPAPAYIGKLAVALVKMKKSSYFLEIG
ncbi:hypothetical protein [Rhizobium rhizogenes]|uniref:hypothetical protein n=1 Tax=Rhizobium rhizogenes TaxID=359 RepID=UPI001573FE7A|nr:hypothetical protein [Rhizobium rhizogenes]NTG40569.1 hypothetical protein [Rhizobium rhizogenes]